MALSGSFDFDFTVGDALNRILRIAGILGEGETASSVQFEIALESLNMQLYQLQVGGVPTWKRDFYETTITQSDYVTGSAGVYRCIKSHTSSSTTEPESGSQWYMHWKEADSSEYSGTPAAWADATAYVSSVEIEVPARFYEILTASAVQPSGNETPFEIIRYTDYQQYSAGKRTSQGSSIPASIAFDYKLTNTGYLYPQPTNTTDIVIRLFGLLKPETATDNSQDLDIPARYYNMLCYNAALDVAYQYSQGSETIQLIMRQAEYHLKKFKTSDTTHVSCNVARGAY